MSTEPIERSGDETPGRRWREAITWAGLLTAGLIVYELTRQPALGTAALCLKFGLEDFKTARWLCRFDPQPARGRAFWWLYVGWGMDKVWMAAMLMIFPVFGVLIACRMAGPLNLGGWFWEMVLGVGLTCTAGVGLSSLAFVWSAVLAFRHGLRLWLHESVRAARRENVWPPYDLAALSPSRSITRLLNFAYSPRFGRVSVLGPVGPSANRLVTRLYLLSSEIFIMPAMGLGMGLGFAVFWVGRIPSFWHMMALMAPILVLSPVPLLIWCYAMRRIVAVSPADCWPPDEAAAGGTP